MISYLATGETPRLYSIISLVSRWPSTRTMCCFSAEALAPSENLAVVMNRPLAAPSSRRAPENFCSSGRLTVLWGSHRFAWI